MPALNSSGRNLPGGLVLCAIALLLSGLALLATGVLFVVAPESLRDAGFGQDVALGRRVAALLMFGGFGALFAWPAWGLIRFSPLALEVARGLGLGFTWLSATRLFGAGESPVFDWLVGVAALAMASYLSLPSVRVRFRPQVG